MYPCKTTGGRAACDGGRAQEDTYRMLRWSTGGGYMKVGFQITC